jgi:DNA replication licensing factor MCM3
VYGFYVPQLKAANIGLPESLQSRFDLIFIVLDKGQSSEHNKLIAGHVLENHSSAEAADQSAHRPDQEVEDDDEDGTSKPTEKFGARKIVSVNFLRKYLQYAKATFHPVLNEEALHEVVEAYVELRERMRTKDISVRITPRTLENIIRLSTAHAKLRLSNDVEKTDVEAAYTLIKHTMTLVSADTGKRPLEGDDPAESNKKARVQDAVPDAPAPEAQEGADFGEHERKLMEFVAEVMRREAQVPLFQIRDTINASSAYSHQPIATSALDAVLKKMEQSGMIVYEDGVVFSL